MDDYKYEVALSFAREQREYVEQVANYLSNLGVKYFYDNHRKVDLWGKNLLKYLDEVYYKNSRYCVMFISKDYKNRYWTNYESEIIEERIFYQNKVEDFQQYILPVKFDDTKISGVRDSWGCISAQETSPIELAEMIYEKIRGKKHSFQAKCQLLDLNDIYTDLANYLPQDYVTKTIKKSVSDNKTDAILLFDNSDDILNDFIYYDGKIFLDCDSKIWILNLGFFNEPEILFETTLEKLKNKLLNKVNYFF